MQDRYEVLAGHAGYGVRDNRTGEFVYDGLDDPEVAQAAAEKAEAAERKRAEARGLLSDARWALLEQAERKYYPEHSGCYAWTDVNPQEESEWPAQLWEAARLNAEMRYDPAEAQGASEEEHIERLTAEAVAAALAVLAFGPDYIREA